eukprot:TRINITY_DN3461_c0_g2_i1.p1 TRINITY_DN3461_c0_g2~~TRINITY_DN3461_c0_g2_i1.p1  ORF type:complete len:223 (-),score=14.41 TRINITY_DN3461_c0_g2_i1:238-906(-)
MIGSKSGGPVEVLVVDDHALFADSLALGLQHERPEMIVSVRNDLSAAVDFLMGRVVQLIILDLDLASESGLDILERLTVIYPNSLPAILLCSAHQRPATIARAFVRGISGFICKDQSIDDFHRAIDCVLAGRRYCAPAISGRVEELEASAAQSETSGLLNPRQIDLLTHLAAGLSNRDIAAAMNVSENTIKTYLKDIYGRLGVNSRIACIRKAASEGLVDLL